MKSRIPVLTALVLPVLALLACTAVCAAQAEMASDADTVLLLKFDEGQGTPGDSSGKGNVVKMWAGKYGPAWAKGASGKPGTAMEFATSSERVRLLAVPDNASLSDMKEITLEARICPSKPEKNGWIITKGNVKQSPAYALYITQAGDLVMALSGVGTAKAPGAVRFGEWQHVAGTFDGSDMRLFVDGDLKATVPVKSGGKWQFNSADLMIGVYGGAGAPYAYAGLIDELRISGAARYTPAQKKTLDNLPGPRITCGKTSLPPVIDGKLSDTCWKESVEAGNFLLMGSKTLAREQTTCRIACDDKYLYISCLCRESVLNPVLNQMDKFKAQVKTRDSSKLFGDDCVELFLSPAEVAAEYYHIAVNSLGNTYDAKGFNNPSSWNAGIKAQAAVADGEWSVEIAVPFADMGRAAPAPGDVWRINLCRSEKALPESSSWSPVAAKGFHSPENFGYLQFAEKSPAVSGPDLAACRDGQYKFSVNARNTGAQPEQASLRVILTCGDEKISYEDEQQVPASASAGLMLNFNASSSNRCLKMEAANGGTDVARTGDIQVKAGTEYRFSALVKVLDYKFHAPSYGLFNILPRDAAGVNVNKGYTVIGHVQGDKEGWQRVSGTWTAPEKTAGAQLWLIAWKGHGSGSFLVDDVRLVDKTTGENIVPNSDFPKGSEFFKWPVLSKTVTPADSYGAGCDEISYLYQVCMGTEMAYQSPQFTDRLDTEIADVKSSFLTVSAHITTSVQAFNVKEVYIAEGSAERLLMAIKSPLYDKIEKMNFQLEMPACFRLVDDFAEREYISPLSCREEAVEKDGMPYRRYTMVFGPDAVSRADCYNQEILPIPLVIKLAGGPAESRRNSIYYRAWIDDSKGEARPNVLKMVNLPPLAGKSPKRLPVYLWGPNEPFLQHGPAAREALISSRGEAGFNYINNSPELDKYFLAHGMRPFALLPTITLGWHFPSAKKYLEKHPEYCERDSKGNKLSIISLARVLEEDCEYRDTIKEIIARWVKAYPYQVNWDYEFAVAKYNSPGFSDANIKSFRKHAGIPESVTLTPEGILKDYRSQWIDFRCWQNGEFARLYRKYIKEANPDCIFSIYSGYQSPHSAEQYGMDWRYTGPAVDLVMCGYGRGTYNETREAAGARYMNGGELIWGGHYDQDPLENTAFQRLTDCGSVMAYIDWIVDGRFSTAYSRAAAVSADFEDFFLNLKREDSLVQGADGKSRADVAVLTHQGERLLFLFNSSPVEKKMEFANISLPDGITAIDYDTKSLIRNPSKMSIAVEPWRVKVIYLKKPGSGSVQDVTGLAAEADGSPMPLLRWQHAQGGSSRYSLQYGEDKDLRSAVSVENIPGNWYLADKPVNPAKSLYWRVRAVDAATGREGAWSAVQKVDPSAQPSAPTGRTADALTDSIDRLGYWTVYWRTGFVKTGKDYQVKREGRYSLYVNGPEFDTGTSPLGYMSNMGRGFCGTRLPRVKEGEKYKFTAWVKTEGPEIKGRIGIRMVNDKGAPVGDLAWSVLDGGPDWKELSVTATVPKGAANISLVAGALEAGKAWLDDFKLARLQ